MIPPAPKNTRQITEHITTTWHPRTKMVTAYCVRFAYERAFDKECCALQDLIWNIEDSFEEGELLSPVELAAAQAVCMEIDAAVENPSERVTHETWLTHPFPRPKRPQRARTQWMNPETGKKENRYLDTGRRFAGQKPHKEEE